MNFGRLNQVFQWLGYGIVNEGAEAGQLFKKILSDWGISYSLSEYGIKADMIEELAVEVTGNLANDRLSEEEQIITTIFKESI